MNTVISLNDYKRDFKQSSAVRSSVEVISPRYELFKERSRRKTTISTGVSLRLGISILFALQNTASSIDSSIVTRYALFPISIVCKVIAKRHKRKLAINILALTNKAEYR